MIFLQIGTSSKCNCIEITNFIQKFNVIKFQLLIETHLGYYPECVLLVFWKKLWLNNFVSRLTDLNSILSDVGSINEHPQNQLTSLEKN